MASGLTLDAGALIGIEKRDRRCQDILNKALERGVRVTLPAVVLAQVWRGNSPLIARLLQGCVVETLDEDQAKSIGALLGGCAGALDVVDAAVVVGAAARHDAIVTSDPDDIHRLLATLRSKCRILPV